MEHKEINVTLKIVQNVQSIVNAVRERLTSITSLPKISGVDRTGKSIRDYSTLAKWHSNEAIIVNIAEGCGGEAESDDLMYLVTAWDVPGEKEMSGEGFDDLKEYSEKGELIDKLVREKRIEAFWRRRDEETEELHIVYRHNADNETYYIDNGEKTDFYVLKGMLTQLLKENSLEDRVTIFDRIIYNTGDIVASSREEWDRDENKEGKEEEGEEKYLQYVPSIKTDKHGVITDKNTQLSLLIDVVNDRLKKFENKSEKPHLQIIIYPNCDEDDEEAEGETWKYGGIEEETRSKNIKVWDVEIYEVNGLNESLNEIDETSEVPNEEKFVTEILKLLESKFPELLFAINQELRVSDGTDSFKGSISWSVRENEFPKERFEELAERLCEYLAINNADKNHTTYNLRCVSHSEENNGKIYVAIEITVHTQE